MNEKDAELKAREIDLNEKVENARKRSIILSDAFARACMSDDQALVEAIREQILEIQGTMMDDIYAHCCILKKLGVVK